MDKIIKILKTEAEGQEYDGIFCPECGKDSKPHGLGDKTHNKIQLVRKCRNCNKLFWYWIDIKGALTPFSED